MYINTKALVLREIPYRETSKLLTVLTPDLGRIVVSARGARRRGSRVATATGQFAFSDMTLSRNRDRYTLAEAQCIESFDGLTDELERMALGAYFCELLEAVSDEDAPNPELLSLGLNGLYALGQEKRPELLVKAAFELRLMCHAGFAPAAECCRVCGRPDPEQPRLDLENGTVRCRECRDEGALVTAVLDSGSLEAMRYIIGCDARRLYAFKLGEESLRRLGGACERYVLTQLDRSFSTLRYYHELHERG